MTTERDDAIALMTAARDLARYIAAECDRELAHHSTSMTDFPAFVDDDSDYLPSATELLSIIIDSLSDAPDPTALMNLIRTDSPLPLRATDAPPTYLYDLALNLDLPTLAPFNSHPDDRD
jgi:hypothetical protein